MTNDSLVPLVGALLAVTSDPAVPDVWFPVGPTVVVPDIGAFASATVEVPIALDAFGAISTGGEL